MRISRFDHIVLTVKDMAASVKFYTSVLGMQLIESDGRTALAFGNQRINLHKLGQERQPHALQPTPGSADLCMVADVTLDELLAHLEARHVPIELGPVKRPGATGQMTSVYFRDPDHNLIELAIYA